MYSITEGFSPILYCRPDVITLGNPFVNKSKFLKATHRTKIRKIEIPRSMVVEALSW